MRFSRFILSIIMISVAVSAPAQAAGLKSKALVGAFAAVGSALATGAIEVAKGFKNESEAHVRLAQAEHELNRRVTQDLKDISFKEGFFFGLILTALVASLIAAMVHQPEPAADNICLAQNITNTDKQEAIKS